MVSVDHLLKLIFCPVSIAKWSGSLWLPVGGGLGWQGSCKVNTIDFSENNEMIVGGSFQYAGEPTTLTSNIALWNGTS